MPEASTSVLDSSKQHINQVLSTGSQSTVNPDLDSFEAVMQAMDVELSKSGTQRAQSHQRGMQNAEYVPDADVDIESVMDAELKAVLEQEQEQTGIYEEDDNEPEMDYNLVKNFLESFKSQAGLAGPVSNLAGRLQQGWMLPRDES